MLPALWFFDHDIGVFPLRPQSKEPACSSWDDYACTREQAGRLRQYGVRLGATLGVLDTDNRDDELWVLQQLARHVIPDTPFVVETARGFHRYYRLTGPMPKHLHRDGHTMEFRNVGQYVVGPGSLHPGDAKTAIPPGKKYQSLGWSWHWEDLPVFPADFLFDDGTCPQASAATNDGSFGLLDVISKNERHETLHRLMRSLVANGVPLDGALKTCRMVNRDRCRPPLDDLDDLERFLRRAYHQKDRADFVRAPKTGWELAGSLCAIGLPVNVVLVAVRSVTPDFDPNGTANE
jgi:hypothetical protein